MAKRERFVEAGVCGQAPEIRAADQEQGYE